MASPPFGEITYSWETSSLESESPSFSRETLRLEKKAIHLPSGDHFGSESWPDCVSWISVLLSSRCSQRSVRKICWSQSARRVAMTTELPSGEISTPGKLTELKKASSVSLGLF